MEIVYRNLRRDIWHFNFFESLKYRSVWIAVILVTVAMVILVINSDSRSVSVFAWFKVAVTFGLGTVLGYLLVSAISTFFTSLSRKHKAILTEHRLAGTDAGLVAESEYGKGVVAWKAIQRIKITRNYVLLYIGLHTAVIIPKRYFKDEAEKQAFIEDIRTRWQNAKTA